MVHNPPGPTAWNLAGSTWMEPSAAAKCPRAAAAGNGSSASRKNESAMPSGENSRSCANDARLVPDAAATTSPSSVYPWFV